MAKCSECSYDLTKDEQSKPLKLTPEGIPICTECKKSVYDEVITDARARPLDLSYRDDLDHQEVYADDHDDFNTVYEKMLQNLEFEKNESRKKHVENVKQTLKGKKDELTLELEKKIRDNLIEQKELPDLEEFGGGRKKQLLIKKTRGRSSPEGSNRWKGSPKKVYSTLGKGGRKKTKKTKKMKKTRKIKKTYKRR